MCWALTTAPQKGASKRKEKTKAKKKERRRRRRENTPLHIKHII
jgi:hypothetical protein